MVAHASRKGADLLPWNWPESVASMKVCVHCRVCVCIGGAAAELVLSSWVDQTVAYNGSVLEWETGRSKKKNSYNFIYYHSP